MRKKYYFYLILFLVLCIGAFYYFYPKKPGFTLAKVRSPLPHSSQWSTQEPTAYEKAEINKILTQDFNYLGSGAQCYVFLSADGKYVLKFFKMKHLLPKNWLNWIPLPGLGKYRFRKINKRVFRQKELFKSYKTAYEHLKDETGLVFIHLNKTKDLKIKAKLYDRMRTCYVADLDNYEFILQKKAQLIRDRLIACMQRGNVKEARKAIHTLLDQVVRQCKKGYIDQDSGISHNYGFVGDEVIHFDAGRIQKDGRATDPFYYQREVLRVGKKLEQWLRVYIPTLLPILEEEINAKIGLDPDLQ